MPDAKIFQVWVLGGLAFFNACSPGSEPIASDGSDAGDESLGPSDDWSPRCPLEGRCLPPPQFPAVAGIPGSSGSWSANWSKSKDAAPASSHAVADVEAARVASEAADAEAANDASQATDALGQGDGGAPLD